jgi:endogenous inhibitor of DNA gyrase (YacG/DUF329 family)
MMGGEAMGEVMIKCPDTGRSVATGIAMDRASFEDPANILENNMLGNCPVCGKDHVWSKMDAFLQED